MQSVSDMLGTYAAYHRDARNRLTHYFGIPLITFSILLILSLPRMQVGPVTITGAAFLMLVVGVGYLRLDMALGLATLALIAPMLLVADQLAQSLTTAELAGWFGVTFIVGWALQLLGHYYEGRKPALADNILQIFSGPLFVVCELLFAFGLRSQLRSAIDAVSDRVDLQLRNTAQS
jgi:uncharacterized membrane protein YGL010W